MFSFFTNETNAYKKTNFEYVQYALNHSNEIILINTLPLNEQICLIKETINAFTEEKIMNDMMHTIDLPDKPVIIYGKNANDDSVYKKYKQLQNLGIIEIYIYTGGLFEWLLLQDIYGSNEFPTTIKIVDILKYKPSK
jgi:hypothetical protein